MFSLLRHRPTTVDDLLSSELFDQDSFYPALMRDLGRCSRELIIESPFITTRRMRTLYPALRQLIGRKVRVTINTKSPVEYEDEAMKRRAAKEIAVLQGMGVCVLLTGGHHRKLAIVDRCILWEGSLNILSQNDSCEIMRRITSDTLAERMVQFLQLGNYL